MISHTQSKNRNRSEQKGKALGLPDANGGLRHSAQSGHEERGGKETCTNRVARVSTQRVRNDRRHGQSRGQADQHVLHRRSNSGISKVAFLESLGLNIPSKYNVILALALRKVQLEPVTSLLFVGALSLPLVIYIYFVVVVSMYYTIIIETVCFCGEYILYRFHMTACTAGFNRTNNAHFHARQVDED